ncbi:hypothetical protein J4Q44_G00038180 [Coregonus suidteri]|uniref:SPRY-associated domain-containing protein n=1 Tax=Coregonus suidteri TaxID=861788 RepID=A0AAN8ME52_9TELE
MTQDTSSKSVQKPRAESPAPSLLSMKSDQPPAFSQEPLPDDNKEVESLDSEDALKITHNLLDRRSQTLLTVQQDIKAKLKHNLGQCGLTEGCCSDLASVLSSPNSQLKQLELRDNDLQDSGVTLLSAGLEDPDCKLHTLGLSGCLVTEEGCAALSSALRSNPSHLKELDLSYNHPGDSAGGLLSAALVDPTDKLMKLNVDHGGEFRLKSGLRKYACHLTLDPNTANPNLILSEGNRKIDDQHIQSRDHGGECCIKPGPENTRDQIWIPQSCKTCDHVEDSTHWLQIEPLTSTVQGVTMFRAQDTQRAL